MPLTKIKTDVIANLDASKLYGTFGTNDASALTGLSTTDWDLRYNLALNFFNDSVRDNMDRLSLHQGWVDTFEDASDIENFNVPIIKLDGVVDYMTLPGVAAFQGTDGKTVQMSFWYRKTSESGTVGTFMEFSDNQNARIFALRHETDNKLHVQVHKNTPFAIGAAVGDVTFSTTLVKDTLYHVLLYVNTAESTATDRIKCFVNGVKETPTVTTQVALNQVLNFGQGSGAAGAMNVTNIGKSTTGTTNYLQGDLGQFWYSHTVSDPGVSANLAKFVTGTGASAKPVNFGVDGSLPTGSIPLAFFNNQFDTFKNNLGAGINFTVVGSLVDGGYLDAIPNISDALYSSESFSNSYELNSISYTKEHKNGVRSVGSTGNAHSYAQSFTLASEAHITKAAISTKFGDISPVGNYWVELQGVTSSPGYATGDRSSSITVTSTLTFQDGATASQYVDGGSGIGPETSIQFPDAVAVSGQNFTFDFGVGVSNVIDEAKHTANSTLNHGTWKWQGSDDNSSYTDIGGTFTFGGATTQTQTTMNGNTTGYRYYRLLGVSGNTNQNQYNHEMEFRSTSTPIFIPNKQILAKSSELNAASLPSSDTIVYFNFADPVILPAGNYALVVNTSALTSGWIFANHDNTQSHSGNSSEMSFSYVWSTKSWDIIFYLYDSKNLDLITKGSDDIGNSPATAPENGHMEVLMTETPASAVTELTRTLDTNSSSNDTGWRVVISNTELSNSAGKVRVTLQAATIANASQFSNVSIVERLGSTSSGTTTPTEILFGGSSGVTIGVSADVTSDWVDFDLDASKDYLLIMDQPASTSSIRYSSSGGHGYYTKAATNSYNLASYPAAGTLNYSANRSAIFVKLETEVPQVLNTDYIGQMSRDGGTAWTNIPLTRIKTQVGGTNNNLLVGEADFTSTSGTNIKGRIKTANKDKITVDGISVNWS